MRTRHTVTCKYVYVYGIIELGLRQWEVKYERFALCELLQHEKQKRFVIARSLKANLLCKRALYFIRNRCLLQTYAAVYRFKNSGKIYFIYILYIGTWLKLPNNT